MAASITVLVAASCDKYTDSGRIFVRMIAFTALRFSVPSEKLPEIMKLFESGPHVSSLDSSPKESQSEEVSGTSGPPSKNISESPNNDDSKSSDNKS